MASTVLVLDLGMGRTLPLDVVRHRLVTALLVLVSVPKGARPLLTCSLHNHPSKPYMITPYTLTITHSIHDLACAHTYTPVVYLSFHPIQSVRCFQNHVVARTVSCPLIIITHKRYLPHPSLLQSGESGRSCCIHTHYILHTSYSLHA